MKISDKFKDNESFEKLPYDPMDHKFIDCPLIPPRAFQIDDRQEVSFYLEPRDKNPLIKFMFSRIKSHFEINYNTSMSNFSEIYDDEKNYPKQAKLMTIEEMLVITREFQNRLKELQAYVDALFEDDGIESGTFKMNEQEKKED